MPRDLVRLTELLRLPDDALLTRLEASQIASISPATFDRAVREKRAPQPVAFSPRTVRWRKADVIAAFRPVVLAGWPSDRVRASATSA